MNESRKEAIRKANELAFDEKIKAYKPKLYIGKLIGEPRYGIIDGNSGTVIDSDATRYYCKKKLDGNYDYYVRAAVEACRSLF